MGVVIILDKNGRTHLSESRARAGKGQSAKQFRGYTICPTWARHKRDSRAAT